MCPEIGMYPWPPFELSSWQPRQSAVVPEYGCFVFGLSVCLFWATAKMMAPFAAWIEWQPVHPTESWPPAARAEMGRAAARVSARPLTSDMRTPLCSCGDDQGEKPGDCTESRPGRALTSGKRLPARPYPTRDTGGISAEGGP